MFSFILLSCIFIHFGFVGLAELASRERRSVHQ
ncbi:hypothetical protein EAOG_04533 [Escherichia coli R527]|nr:hypothetical protein EAOG_04533 [Escherichia coli R527]OSK53531.1 hypothetical protein EAFG_01880 [Escherichia coli H413]OSL42377.1 hypothetical protein EARG_01460 [Escherichia coli H461]